MEKPIRILATEEIKNMLECMEKQYDIQAEFIPDASGKIVEKIACTQPDAVILKMFMPGTDAIEVIKAYRMLYSGSTTYFAVISPFITGTLKNELNQCGVSKIIQGACSTRELLSMFSELQQFRLTPLATLKSSVVNTVHMVHRRGVEQSQEYRFSLQMEIDKVFETLGLNHNEAGSDYLKKAVEIAALSDSGTYSVTKVIYPSVAAEFGTSPSCVERRIRGTIYEAWKSDHSAVITSYFGYTVDNMRGRPTNSELIAMLADRIRLGIASDSHDIGSERKRLSVSEK